MLSEKILNLNLEKLITEVKPASAFLGGVEAELLNRGETPRLPLTTLPTLNTKIWGLRYGLTVIGARTSIGKSAMALQMAYDLALQNKRVLFLSLEMTVDSMLERIFCSMCEVDNFDTLTGQLKINQSIAKKWMDFKDRLTGVPLILTCGIGLTCAEIERVIDHLEEKPDAIFVDYIQAVKISRNEREALNEYIRHFRGLCIQNNIAGVMCSQANRQVLEDESKEPTLGNLKSTGFLEEHAETVILLHWPHFYDNNKAENDYKVIIAKQRNGRTGAHMLHYKPEFYKFYDVESKRETQEDSSDDCDQPVGWGA